MDFSPISLNQSFKGNICHKKLKKQNQSLSDVEFNIITDTLKIKNSSKNNFNFRLKNLKQKLNG